MMKEDRLNNIAYALNAAEYNWGKILEWAKKKLEGNPRPMFHIRSMSWELYSAFDYLLQFINEKLDLGIAVSNVKWDKEFKNKLKKANQAIFADVSNLSNSQLFKYVKSFRNYSHKWCLDRGFIWLHSEGLGDFILLNNQNRESSLPPQISVSTELVDKMGILINNVLRHFSVSLKKRQGFLTPIRK